MELRQALAGALAVGPRDDLDVAKGRSASFGLCKAGPPTNRDGLIERMQRSRRATGAA
jgi:hypothetical protein